jgi:CRISPR-associated protein Cas5h
MTMDTLVFDISGEFALFKKAYAPMSPVSYPFPPPTAITGILGAIAGYGKHDYAERLGWQRLRIAVRVLKQPRRYPTALNLLNTKDGTDSFFRPKADRNTHIRVPCEFLCDVAYRLYVAGLPASAQRDLIEQLSAGTTVYSLSLGWASCLADAAWVGLRQAMPVTDRLWSCSSVLPLTPGIEIDYEDQRRYHRLRIPVVMDPNREVQRFQEVVSSNDDRPINGSGQSPSLFQIDDETIAFL